MVLVEWMVWMRGFFPFYKRYSFCRSTAFTRCSLTPLPLLSVAHFVYVCPYAAALYPSPCIQMHTTSTGRVIRCMANTFLRMVEVAPSPVGLDEMRAYAMCLFWLSDSLLMVDADTLHTLHTTSLFELPWITQRIPLHSNGKTNRKTWPKRSLGRKKANPIKCERCSSCIPLKSYGLDGFVGCECT